MRSGNFLLTAFVLTGVLLQTPPAALAEPFTCEEIMFFLSLNINSGSDLKQVDTSSWLTTPAGPPTTRLSYNAIAFNHNDGYIYAIDSASYRVLKIGTSSITNLGVPAGGPGVMHGRYLAGSFVGNLYLVGSTTGSLVAIDITTAIPTLVFARNMSYRTGNDTPNIVDFAVSPIDAQIYAFDRNRLRFATINPTTGLVTPYGMTHTFDIIAGAAFFEASGSFFVYGRNPLSPLPSGSQDTFMHVSVIGGLTPLATGPPASGVDGASCLPQDTIFWDDFESGDISSWLTAGP